MISKLCAAVETPVNVVRGIGLKNVRAEELAAAGVKRISAGSALARVAYGAMIEAASRSFDAGSFTAFDDAASFAVLDKLITKADHMRDG